MYLLISTHRVTKRTVAVYLVHSVKLCWLKVKTRLVYPLQDTFTY